MNSAVLHCDQTTAGEIVTRDVLTSRAAESLSSERARRTLGRSTGDSGRVHRRSDDLGSRSGISVRLKIRSHALAYPLPPLRLSPEAIELRVLLPSFEEWSSCLDAIYKAREGESTHSLWRYAYPLSFPYISLIHQVSSKDVASMDGDEIDAYLQFFEDTIVPGERMPSRKSLSSRFTRTDPV